MLDLVFGNEENRKMIGEGIANGTLPHALILEGGAGSGRRTLAKEIAAALLCEGRATPGSALPCHRCEACRKVSEGLTPDVTVLGKEGKTTIGVAPIREIRADMFLSPTESEEKIYIVEDADSLTEQAQNALLVVLEEPPTGVRILLLAESAEALLTTVRSRARLLRMSRFTPEEIDRFLSARMPNALQIKAKAPSQYAALLQGADGRIGKALTLLDPETGGAHLARRKAIDGILSCLTSTPSFSSLTEAFAALPTARPELMGDLTLLLDALRDLALMKRTNTPPLCYYTDLEEAAATAKRIPLARLVKATDAVSQTVLALERNGNIALLCTNLKDQLKYT